MNGWAWLLIGWYVYSILFAITQIGKPRAVYTPGVVATSAVIIIGLMWVVVLAATT